MYFWDGPSASLPEEKMDYLDLIDQVIEEPSSRAASERNLLAEILKTNDALFEDHELDPDDLYRQLVSDRNGAIAGHFMLLARPGEMPLSPPQAGDILLRVAPGHPGLGHVAVIADETLYPHDQLDRVPFGSERVLPGYYAGVIEAGAFPTGARAPLRGASLTPSSACCPGRSSSGRSGTPLNLTISRRGMDLRLMNSLLSRTRR